MKLDKSNLKIVAVLVSLFLAIAIPAAIATYYFQHHFTATIGVNEEAIAYLDQACTSPIPTTKDWGPVGDGDVLSIWIRNEGNVQIDVTVSIPTQTDCTITLSWTTKTFTVNQVEQLTMTVSTGAVGGSTISWDLDIDAVQS